MSVNECKNLVLASASQSRALLLANVGLEVNIIPAHLDEAALKHRYVNSNKSISDVARLIAQKKAEKISKLHPNSFIIGADQMLDCRGRWFNKPNNIEQAEATLRYLRGRSHELITSICVIRKGITLWNHTELACLTMRKFSDDFLSNYLAVVSTETLNSVGAYQIEGLGAQLFENIDGNYFTILGLPLLPLLTFLRQHEVVSQ